MNNTTNTIANHTNIDGVWHALLAVVKFVSKSLHFCFSSNSISTSQFYFLLFLPALLFLALVCVMSLHLFSISSLSMRLTRVHSVLHSYTKYFAAVATRGKVGVCGLKSKFQLHRKVHTSSNENQEIYGRRELKRIFLSWFVAPGITVLSSHPCKTKIDGGRRRPKTENELF